MKVTFVILAAILGGVFALDLPTAPRAWTGWDIASRSIEIEDKNVGEPRAWTGWDIASRSGEIGEETVGDDVPAARDPRFMNTLNAAAQRLGGMIEKGQELRTEIRNQMRETLLITARRMNETLNYYCKKEETGNYTCSVCAQLMISNYTLCSNLIIDQTNLELTANIRINNLTIIERSIGAQNPPPMCVPIPYIPVCQFCLRAYNLKFNGTKEFKGCLEAELSMQPVHTFDLPLTCMKIDDTGVHFNTTVPENRPAKKRGSLKRLL